MSTMIFSSSKSDSSTSNKGQVVDKRSGSNSCEFVEHPDGHRLDVNKIMGIMSRLKCLTLPYCDSEGNSLQLWKMHPSVLIGTAQNKHGKIIIVPADKIRALSIKSDSSFIIRQLEQAPIKQWHIAFNPQSKEMDLWPSLIAAGKGWFIEVEKSPYKNMTKEQVIEKLRQDGFVKKYEKGHYINEQTGEKAYVDPRNKNCFREPNHVDFLKPGEEKPIRLYYRDPYGLHQYRLKHPKGGSSSNRPNLTPAQRLFEQTLRQSSVEFSLIDQTFPTSKDGLIKGNPPEYLRQAALYQSKLLEKKDETAALAFGNSWIKNLPKEATWEQIEKYEPYHARGCQKN